MDDEEEVKLLKEHSSIKKSLLLLFAEHFYVDSCNTLVNDFDIDILPEFVDEAAYILTQNPDIKHSHMNQEGKWLHKHFEKVFIDRFEEKIV